MTSTRALAATDREWTAHYDSDGCKDEDWLIVVPGCAENIVNLSEEQAELIVRAVNANDDLVAALEQAAAQVAPERAEIAGMTKARAQRNFLFGRNT